MENIFITIVQNEISFAWIYQLLLLAVASMIPFAPIPVLAAFIASNYTIFWGFVINMIGTTFGSFILFIFSKNILRSVALKYVAKKQYLSTYIAFIENNGFAAVLLGRIIPIVPSAGINLLAGISNVPFGAFITATFLGKLPVILAYSLAGHQIAAGNWGTVLIISLYIVLLFLIGMKFKRKWRK